MKSIVPLPWPLGSDVSAIQSTSVDADHRHSGATEIAIEPLPPLAPIDGRLAGTDNVHLLPPGLLLGSPLGLVTVVDEVHAVAAMSVGMRLQRIATRGTC
jgi:hypothetical protein